jgi:hypothetical protein
MTSLAPCWARCRRFSAFGPVLELLQPARYRRDGGFDNRAALLSLVVTPTVYAMLHRQSARQHTWRRQFDAAI